MTQFFQRFSDPSFMPHGHCYMWQADILWLHVGSSAIIALAYFLIPVVLFVFAAKNKYDLPHKDLIYLFTAFILLCGFTHLTDIYTTWHPAYLFQGWAKAATAAVSIVTALVLVPKLPELLNMGSVVRDYRKLEARYAAQQAENENMQAVYQASLDRENRLVELKREVNAELLRQGLPSRYTTPEEPG